MITQRPYGMHQRDRRIALMPIAKGRANALWAPRSRRFAIEPASPSRRFPLRSAFADVLVILIFTGCIAAAAIFGGA